MSTEIVTALEMVMVLASVGTAVIVLKRIKEDDTRGMIAIVATVVFGIIAVILAHQPNAVRAPDPSPNQLNTGSALVVPIPYADGVLGPAGAEEYLVAIQKDGAPNAKKMTCYKVSRQQLLTFNPNQRPR